MNDVCMIREKILVEKNHKLTLRRRYMRIIFIRSLVFIFENVTGQCLQYCHWIRTIISDRDQLIESLHTKCSLRSKFQFIHRLGIYKNIVGIAFHGQEYKSVYKQVGRSYHPRNLRVTDVRW